MFNSCLIDVRYHKNYWKDSSHKILPIIIGLLNHLQRHHLHVCNLYIVIKFQGMLWACWYCFIVYCFYHRMHSFPANSLTILCSLKPQCIRTAFPA